jgi:uncharacterized membrane protein YeaQ/YmgE (transglycosylase-associated protein family)
MLVSNTIVFLFVGLISGWLASLLVEGRGLGLLMDLALGIIGAFVGGSLMNSFGLVSYGMWGAIATSVIGAVILLLISKIIFGASRSGRMSSK